MMKKTFAFLWIFVTFYGFPQDKKTSGYYTVKRLINNIDSIISIKNYNIYLLKDLNPESKSKLLLHSENEKFEISISKKDLKKYYYLEFVSIHGNALYVLNKI